MSKLLPFLVAGVGASSVSVGGVWMLKRTGGGAEQNKSKTTDSPISNELTQKTLNDFKNKKDWDCIKKFFGGEVELKTIDSSKALSSSNKVTTSDFPGTTEEDSQGCLVVNWEKTSAATGGNWKGEFRWLWTFVKGKKGVVAFASFKQSSAEKKLDLEAGIYFLGKSGSPENWSVEKYSEVPASGSTKSMEKSSVSTMFPEKGESITELTDANPNHWGFMTSADDMEKACSTSSSSCPEAGSTTKTFKGSWKWHPDSKSGKEADKWTKNLSSILSGMYGNDLISIGGAFNNIKGSWKKEQISPAGN